MKEFIHYNISLLTTLGLGFGGFCTLTNQFYKTKFNEPFVHGLLVLGLALSVYILGAAKNKIQGISELALSTFQLWLAVVGFTSLAIIFDGISGDKHLSTQAYLNALALLIVPILLFFGIRYLRKYINKKFESAGAGQPDNPSVKL